LRVARVALEGAAQLDQRLLALALGLIGLGPREVLGGLLLVGAAAEREREERRAQPARQAGPRSRHRVAPAASRRAICARAASACANDSSSNASRYAASAASASPSFSRAAPSR